MQHAWHGAARQRCGLGPHEAAESHEPIVISGKRNSAVLLSAEGWSAIQETLYLLAVPGMRASIKVGMAEPLEVFPEEKTVRVLRMWTHHA